MKNLVLLALVVVCAHCAKSPPPLKEFHRDLQSRDLEHYFGVQVRQNVPDYEIVHIQQQTGRRHARAAAGQKEPLRYDFAAFGEQYILDLEHNDKLIAPGCLVYQFKSNGTRKVRPCPVRENDCYYHGKSLTHNGSQAAVSTCTGVTGLVRLPEREYDLWIQPVKKEHVPRAKRSVNSPTPHVVVKRAVYSRPCAADGVPAAVSNMVSAVRQRRDAADRYAEMLLVADKTMHEAHGDDLHNFLLAVANVAARILVDGSLGTAIHFSVVKIQVLENDEPGLTIVEDATETLSNFCAWQEQYNVQDDNDPQHHDGAALFTRLDIVQNGVRDTTGYATVSGMCGNKKRCSYNQDTGVNTGVTLAHETGHTLGMLHDGAGNSCQDKQNVMSSGGGGGKTALSWSDCSRKALNDFLATSDADCLKDVPQQSVDLPKDLPGVLYDGDDQCRLFQGEGSTLCVGTRMIAEAGGDECSRLVCYDPKEVGICVSDSVPRMDGTMCGQRKYCMHGQCVEIGPNGPPAVNGGWSEFDREWSPCSRSCGGGVRVRRRRCDNPRPRLGGKDCEGSNVMAELCNMQPCGASQETFREEQCALTDPTPMDGKTYHWVPISQPQSSQQCELHCKIAEGSIAMLRRLDNKNIYRDGTVCAAENAAFSRCVDGICLNFGCDGKTDSSYQYDKCGVCGGQGDTCSKISGKYTQGEKEKYVTFVTIPAKATSITITNSNKFTHMAIMVGNERIFNKNGATNDGTGLYSRDGVVVRYNQNQESIEITGPLPLPIEAQVWRMFSDADGYQGVAPDITYEYYLPSSTGPSDYSWQTTNGECSKTCGGGVYNRIITCIRTSGGSVVDDHFCDINEKPSTVGPACNNQACPARWKVGDYGACSKTCSGGKQTREVQCVRDADGKEEAVDVSNCPANRRPADTRDCNLQITCPGVWITGTWSACSLTCGKGVQTRTVACVKDTTSNEPQNELLCPAAAKPEAQQTCVQAVCKPDINGDACKDLTDCGRFEPTACQDSQYAAYMQNSCMKTCFFCASEGTVSTCEDKSTDCPGYGMSICTGQYADWAKQTCPKMCGFCGGSTGAAACEDKTKDCPGYGMSICNGDYKEWAKENCAKMCGYCGGDSAVTTPTVTSTPSVAGVCQDLNADCPGYGQTICGGQYEEWAKQNCAKMCGHCASSNTGSTAAVTQPITNPHTTTTSAPKTTTLPTTTTPTTATRTSSPTTTVAAAEVSACQDKDGNCAGYGISFCTQEQYAPFARENCARHCKLCPGTAGQEVECKDATDNCPQYGESVCSDTAYSEWVQMNCPRFCGVCGASSSNDNIATTTTTTTLETQQAWECRDQADTCPQYTSAICSDGRYTEWVRINCARFCGLCRSDSITTTTTTAATTAAAILNDCKDVLSNCDQYDPSACKDPVYELWAKVDCARFCNMCEDGASTTEVTTTPMTTTATTVITTTTSPAAEAEGSCKDQLSNCPLYGKGVCTNGNYTLWARANCARFCDLCDEAAGGQGRECKDALANCNQYDPVYCQQEAYRQWAETSCAQSCGLCDVTTTATSQGTTAPSDDALACKDVLSNCAQFDDLVCSSDAYQEWARSNCAKFCNLCSASDTVTSPSRGDNCKDAFENCAGYGQAICSDAQYAEWVAQNCRGYCGLCGGGSGLGTSASAGSGTGTRGDVSGIGTGTGTGTGSGPPNSAATGGHGTCQDKFDNCQGYGASVCSTYVDWAQDNCRSFCNKCTARRRRSILMSPSPRPVCNTVLTDLQGSLALIGQPLDTSCSHVIVAPIGSRVRLSFTALRISCKEGDWLEVQEEGAKKAKVRHDLCDVIRRPTEWASRGNIVTVRMSVAKPGHGYNMTYTVLLSPPHPGCDRLLTDPTGVVSSPGFPGEYPSNKLCVTTIVAPPGYSVLLSFSLLELESGDCTKDSVTVVDQEEGTRDVFCGFKTGLSWLSKGNKVKVFFASDSQNSAKGFLAAYRFVAPW